LRGLWRGSRGTGHGGFEGCADCFECFGSNLAFVYLICHLIDYIKHAFNNCCTAGSDSSGGLLAKTTRNEEF